VKNIAWKDVLESVGMLAIIASLIFIGLQMRQEHSIARSQIWSERNILRAELATLINEHPQIWTKGLKGEKLSEPETAQFEAIFTVYLFKEATHYNQRLTGMSPGRPEGISDRFANMITTYPGMMLVWSRWRASRAALFPFGAEVERQLERIKSGRSERIEVEMLVPY